MFISERRRRRRWPVTAGLALAALAAAAVVAFLILQSRTAEVHRGEQVEFQPKKPSKPKNATFAWPFYRYDLAHRSYLPARLHPPYRRMWTFSGEVLMEFPPVLARDTLYFVRNNGGTYALDARTGHVKWKKRLGTLAAASPGYWKGRLYVPSLSQKIVALRAKDGKLLWQKLLPSRTESSPIVHEGVLYFGTEGGTLYALWARSGKVKWTFNASGALKGSPAFSHDTLYIGDYSGRMYAVRASNGNQKWATGTSGARFGLSSGNFYSTPAVAFGRVYAGNTDGKVYSFSATTGELAWSKSTGGYVYSSPAVANVAGTKPSVYVGSYDGNLYALDARTGAVLWTQRGGGRISGGPTVVGRVVYFADIDSKSTYGAGVRTGKRVFHIDRGAYNPVISDGKHIYLTGYSSLTALKPKRPDRRSRAN